MAQEGVVEANRVRLHSMPPSGLREVLVSVYKTDGLPMSYEGRRQRVEH